MPSRLHHNAYLTKDQEATRAFYEDLIGLPLVATWSEADELFGAVRVYCHTFFALGDGSALAFFQFADKADQDEFDPALTPSPFRHIALKVTPDLQQEIHERLTSERVEARGHVRPRARLLPLALHGGPERAAARVHRRLSARPTTSPSSARPTPTTRCKRWLAGDHTSNNVYR